MKLALVLGVVASVASFILTAEAQTEARNS